MEKKQQEEGGKETNENGVENGGVSAEDTSVDEFIDFAKLDEMFGQSDKIVHDKEEAFQLQPMSPLDPPLRPRDELDICLPASEQENLIWLGYFVDESLHKYSLTMQAKNIPVEPEAKPVEKCCVTFQTKARSKRVRNSARVWSLNDSGSSSSSSSSACSPLNDHQVALYNEVGQSAEKPVVKKQKQKPKQDAGEEARRCSHCLVEKTPQWRAGPMGAKTLCNACGVRYKSGRLLPEYRPAISPTFSSEKHSNNHRKVMEMRRNKEV